MNLKIIASIHEITPYNCFPRKRIMNRNLQLFICFWLIFITVAAVYFTANATMQGVLKFVIVIAELVASGMLLQKLMNLEGEWGMILLRDQRGLKFIDSLAKKSPEKWKMLADLGLVLGFGLLAFFFIKDKKKEMLRNVCIVAVGILILLVVSFFIAPNLYAVTSSVIFSVDMGAASADLKEVTGGSSLFAWIALGALIVGGISMTAVMGILMKGALVFIAIAEALLGNGAKLAQTAPGATLIIPGINLPLFEGLIALAILLVVHEGGHAVLARVAKIKLKSAGIVLLGVVPAGAFVDPDEKQLSKAEDTKQTRVLGAGSAANIMTSIIAFILLTGFIIGTEGMREDVMRIEKLGNASAELSRQMPSGTLIYAINGKNIADVTNLTFANNSEVMLKTASGDAKVKADSNGKLSGLAPFSVIYKDGGAIVVKGYKDGKADALYGSWTFAWKKEYAWLWYPYCVLALLFVLNFLVGAINLMPIPIFDGHRILSINLKNQLAVNIITALVVAGFIANFLPWLVK